MVLYPFDFVATQASPQPVAASASGASAGPAVRERAAVKAKASEPTAREKAAAAAGKEKAAATEVLGPSGQPKEKREAPKAEAPLAPAPAPAGPAAREAVEDLGKRVEGETALQRQQRSPGLRLFLPLGTAVAVQAAAQLGQGVPSLQVL